MIILALCFISEKNILFPDAHLHTVFLKVPICLCAKGHRQQNFFFDFSWKWTKSRLPEVGAMSRKSALKTWKNISEFKPIAISLSIPWFQMSYFRWNLPRTERSFIRENSNIAFLYMNQCPIVRAVCWGWRINLFSNPSVFKFLCKKFWKIFHRALKHAFFFSHGCSNSSMSLQISGHVYLLKDVTWWPLNH